MLLADDLQYDLPDELIAARAAEPRDSARLFVVSRSDRTRIEHRTVRDLPELLEPRDVAVFNRSRVLRARVRATRADTGGRVEGLFLERAGEPAGAWKMLLKSNGRLHNGLVLNLHKAHDEPTGQSLRLVRRDAEAWVVKPEPAALDPALALERVGSTPLPPYILRARKETGITVDDDQDRSRYQTVYAQQNNESPGDGSVAAPTAGLHFTDDLLARLDALGVRRQHLELQVGWGTFKPVQCDRVEDHPMHEEWCSVSPSVIAELEARESAPKNDRGRLFSIGTTTARALESVPTPVGQWSEHGWKDTTRLLITPGYSWRFVDGLLTNFHLPRSTLLAMTAALFPEGVDRLMELYRIAVAERYRFYSYGDAMLILP